MSVKIKICGIRNLEAAITAVDAGADFLGFNFVPTSQRYIDPMFAQKIIKLVKGKVKIVGVFQNAKVSDVNDITSKLGLDFVQLHGKEDDDYISNVAVPVIKSFKVDDVIHNTKAAYILLDRVKQGEGKMVDLEKAAKLVSNFLLFYTGGLNPDNVAEVVKKVKPFAVDVAGGVEIKGIQDLEKIRLFIKNAKGVSIWKDILENMAGGMYQKC